MLITALLAALWIMGAHAITREGYLLSFLSIPPVPFPFPPKFRPTHIKIWRFMHWLSKPLTECPTCMSSVHGAAWWLITGGTWWLTPIFCIVVAGMVELLTSIAWRRND